MVTYMVWVFRQTGESPWWNSYPNREAARQAFETLKKFYAREPGWASVDLNDPDMRLVDSFDNSRFEPANS